MIFCRVIDRQKYDSVLKDLDLQRSRLRKTGPPDETELRAACTAVHDRATLEKSSTKTDSSQKSNHKNRKPKSKEEHDTLSKADNRMLRAMLTQHRSGTTDRPGRNVQKPCRRCSTAKKPVYHPFHLCPNVKCHACGKLGHIQINCPMRNMKGKGNDGDEDTDNDMVK